MAWGHAHFYWLVILVLTWGQEDELGLIPPAEVDFKPALVLEVVVVAFDFEDAFSDDGRAVATITAAWSEFDGLGLGSGEEICENKVAVVIIALLLLCSDDAEEQDEIKRDLNM